MAFQIFGFSAAASIAMIVALVGVVICVIILAALLISWCCCSRDDSLSDGEASGNNPYHQSKTDNLIPPIFFGTRDPLRQSDLSERPLTASLI
jgi:hypothetical protein